MRRKPREPSLPFYDGPWGDALYRLHPAIGARPVLPEERRFLFPLVDSELPDEWRALSDEDEDAAYEGWSRAVLSAVAALGESRIHLQTSDKRGLDALRALPGVTARSSVGFVCEPTSEVIDAVVETNVSQLVQTVDGTPYLMVLDGWGGIFLTVSDSPILARFSHPWRPESAA